MRYALFNAIPFVGHLNPLLVRDGAVRELKGATTYPLGLIELERSLPSATTRLQSGDRLLIYSDGIVEARLEDGTRFGTERLKRLLIESAGQPPSSLSSPRARSPCPP